MTKHYQSIFTDVGQIEVCFLLPVLYTFPTMFSKGLLLRVVVLVTLDCEVKAKGLTACTGTIGKLLSLPYYRFSE